MLEIRNVTKIYKTKGGAVTKALDDVSISFAETGLVFLLGKSGSGKSTLLNVSGGLDDPTQGEIIVKGKSSKDFSGADFDSYRNTFVGFVFQEYNVLDEFNVEDNIALALELQGKPKDREKINALLGEVDLKDYAKRKPNTLSGGQKQRIAIARALIKEPQIIMADEPTGALDSATGKQVFDTLKKLSRTRLVIVVSHDREFAETYGDRIVELKDGKIISDVTKRSIAPEAIDGNISVVGGDTLTIKSGAELTQQNIAAINDFLMKSEGDVIIARGKKEVIAFRKANRMSETGDTESFSDTAADDVKLKKYNAEDSKFIRSRLPASKAIRIGASGLKLKPIRLVFTIFLSFVAFVMFGLFSTLMTYDGDSVAANSFVAAGGDYINLDKKYHYRWLYSDGSVEESDWSNDYARFTPEELDAFRGKYGSDVFATFGRSYVEISNADIKKGESDKYYVNHISKFTQTEQGSHVIPLVAGEYPKAKNEICISTYLVTVLVNSDCFLVDEDGKNVDLNGNRSDKEVAFEVNGIASILGKNLRLSLGGNYAGFKVVGVFDSGEIDPKYDGIRDDSVNMNSAAGYMLYYQYTQYIAEGLHSLAIVSESFYDDYGALLSYGGYVYVEEFNYFANDLQMYYMNKENGGVMYISAAKVYNPDNAYYTPEFLGTHKTALADDEIIVSSGEFWSLVNLRWRDLNPAPNEEDYIDPETGWPKDEYWNVLNEYYQKQSEFFGDMYNRGFDFYNDILNGYYREYDEENDTWINREPTKSERAEAVGKITEYLKLLAPDGYIPIKLAKDDRSGEDCKIVGWFPNAYDGNVNRGIYVSQKIYDSLDTYDYITSTMQTNYVEPENAIYDGIYIPYDHTADGFRAILSGVGYKNIDKATDVFYDINSSLYDSVQEVNQIADTLSTVFLVVGTVFAVFASLLMFNFISMSISNKRKEIGILRAVGARGTDVFKIFFAESGIIMGICLVLSIIGSIVLSIVINNILRTSVGLAVTVFVFGIVSVLMMLALALVVAVISTFLPVYFAARKKPVESIRAL